MVRLILIVLVIVLSYRFRFLLIVLFEDILEAIKENYAEYKYKRMLGKELKKYEFQKYTDPQTHFKVWVATLIVTIIAFGIVLYMLDLSTKTSYKEYKKFNKVIVCSEKCRSEYLDKLSSNPNTVRFSGVEQLCESCGTLFHDRVIHSKCSNCRIEERKGNKRVFVDIKKYAEEQKKNMVEMYARIELKEE